MYSSVCASALYLDPTIGSHPNGSHYQASSRPPGTQLVSNLSDDKKTLLASILLCVHAMGGFNKSPSNSEISPPLNLSIRSLPPSLNKCLVGMGRYQILTV